MDLSSNFRKLLEFCLPTACILCQKRQELELCPDCLEELRLFKVSRCIICATPSHKWVCKSCQINQPTYDATDSVACFFSRLQPAIQSLRLRGQLTMASGIISAWLSLNAERSPPVDLILPVPLAPDRLKLKGFNPAWELAKKMGQHKKIPSTADLLLRHPSSQIIPEAKKFRTEALRELFYLNDQYLEGQSDYFYGKRIAVVDDFMNTGATFEAISALLKENGASWVSNWVILRVPKTELF